MSQADDARRLAADREAALAALRVALEAVRPGVTAETVRAEMAGQDAALLCDGVACLTEELAETRSAAEMLYLLTGTTE